MKRFLLFLPFLAGCSNVPQITNYLSPYRIDVRQGNFVTQEMAAQLKPGLSRDQVRFILGSPLVADMFHSDRWDYIYRFQAGRGDVEQRRLTVFFKDNKLTRVAGDVVPDDASKGQPPKPIAQIIEIPARTSASPAPASAIPTPAPADAGNRHKH